MNVVTLAAELLFGFLYASLAEFLAHKYVLHHMGVKKDSFWADHWHKHHRNARKYSFYDPNYEAGIYLLMDKHGREHASVILLLISHIWLAWVLPFAYSILIVYGLAYLYLHRRMHLHPLWAKKWFPHHYDHHMASSQQQNWGVVCCIWDRILLTRVRYSYSSITGKVTKL